MHPNSSHNPSSELSPMTLIIDL